MPLAGNRLGQKISGRYHSSIPLWEDHTSSCGINFAEPMPSGWLLDNTTQADGKHRYCFPPSLGFDPKTGETPEWLGHTVDGNRVPAHNKTVVLDPGTGRQPTAFQRYADYGLDLLGEAFDGVWLNLCG